ncbi:unnamed protein product [Strongylus vulgaris]|uniref:Phospholipid/glycerol acyltransferase domain-containing protein n=1 Tax=Strongylus vulgaris TaxID=40348 RepID=A0A3P7LP43_STRVU|nr:unnamed protein product [Strongylus vulgaris]
MLQEFFGHHVIRRSPHSLIEYVFGTSFHVTGDLILRDKPALIIMNHRTRLDWLFLWNALYKMDPLLLTTEKISLKAALKRIPGAGWAMGCGSFIFLERNFESDKCTISSAIEYYRESGNNYQVCCLWKNLIGLGIFCICFLNCNRATMDLTLIFSTHNTLLTV